MNNSKNNKWGPNYGPRYGVKPFHVKCTGTIINGGGGGGAWLVLLSSVSSMLAHLYAIRLCFFSITIEHTPPLFALWPPLTFVIESRAPIVERGREREQNNPLPGKPNLNLTHLWSPSETCAVPYDVFTPVCQTCARLKMKFQAAKKRLYSTELRTLVTPPFHQHYCVTVYLVC